MLTSLALLALATSPGRLALFSIDGGGFTAEQRAGWAARLADTFDHKAYPLLTPSAMPAPVAKSGVGCGKDLSCLGALAAELEVQSLLTCSLRPVGERVHVELQVFNAADGRPLAAARAEAANVEAVDRALDEAVTALVVQFEVAPEPPPSASPAKQGPPGLGVGFWAPVISGAVVMAAGGFVLGSAVADLNTPRGVGVTNEEYGRRIGKDIIERNVGIVGLCFGAASVLAGVIFGRPAPAAPAPPVSVGLSLIPGGGGVAVTGAF